MSSSIAKLSKAASKKTTLKCRMYRKKLPETGDHVLGKILSQTDLGFLVSLPEYEKEGFLPSSKISRRNRVNVKQLITLGQSYVFEVDRVDEEKSYIDLSKRNVRPQDEEKFHEAYNKTKRFHGILKNIALTSHSPLKELYKQFGWKLYEDSSQHPADLLIKFKEDPTLMEKYDVPVALRESLLKIVSKRNKKEKFRVEAEVEIICFNPKGIRVIKDALSKGLDEHGLTEIKLVAPPLYSFLVKDAATLEEGMEKIKASIKAVEVYLLANDGTLTIKREPAGKVQ